MKLTKEFPFIIVMLFLAFKVPVTFSQEKAPNKEATLRKAAGQWLKVGVEEYNRGMYIQAENAFLSAREYYSYMTKEQRTLLEMYSDKTHEAYLEVVTLSKQVDKARELLANDELIEAKKVVEQIKNNEFLTKIQTKQFGLVDLEAEINSIIQKKQQEIDEVFGLSVQAYRDGDLETAKKGFEHVTKQKLATDIQRSAAAGYIERINSLLKREETPFVEEEVFLEQEPTGEPAEQQEPQLPASSVPAEMTATEPAAVNVPEPVKVRAAAEPKTPEQRRKEKLLRSYSQAVVNDATKKVETFIRIGDAFKARQAVRNAEKIINENRESLGEELYQQHISQLQELSRQIE